MISTYCNTAAVDEAQVSLYIGNEMIANFFCTPQEISELCIGHLYIQGIINKAEDVLLKEVETREPRKIIATLYPHTQNLQTQNQQVRGTRDQLDRETQAAPPTPPIEELRSAAAEMFAMAEIYPKCGGVHCSALLEGSEIVAFKEDIGRHNAMDKVIGEALQKHKDISQLIYLTSGRINAEIINKAARAGLRIVVSRSIVSTIALEKARKHGIGLVGRIEWKEPIVYEERITTK